MKKVNAYSYLKFYKKEMILGPLFKMLEVVFELLTPFFISYIIDVGINRAAAENNYLHIIIPDLIILLFCVLGFLSTLVCQYYASIASQGFGTKIRDAIYKKIIGLDAGAVEKIGKANLNTIITNDSIRLQTSVAMLVRLVLRAPAIVIGSLVCSFIINYKVGFVFGGLVIAISLIIFIVVKESTKRIKNAQNKTDNLIEIVSDDIRGSRYIKSFNLTENEINKFKDESEEYRKSMNKVNFLNALTNPLTLICINIVLVLIIYFSVFQVIPENSDFTKGNLASLIQYLNQISIALIVVLNLIVIFNKAFASKKRIETVLELENQVVEKSNSIDAKTLNFTKIVEFCDVFYGFNENFPIIKDLNLSIKKGEIIGIIGGTGSGKSTLARLIKREFDATKGEVLFKEKNVKELSLNSLRSEVTHIAQDSNLFKGTIKSNFLLIKPDATDDEINEALKLGCAFDFVKDYKEGLDHEVLEDGKNFSGGQKQRLLISLGLIRKTPLLILDDSSSALDNLTQKQLNQNIKKLDSTVVIISQKISSIKFADRIYVMENGTILDSGSHEELLKKCEFYRNIFESQRN